MIELPNTIANEADEAAKAVTVVFKDVMVQCPRCNEKYAHGSILNLKGGRIICDFCYDPGEVSREEEDNEPFEDMEITEKW